MHVNTMKKALDVTKDAGTAWMLERIAFWMQHATIEHEGVWWIAKNYEGWAKETHLTYTQVKYLFERLRTEELVQTRRAVWRGSLQLHVALTPRAVRLLEIARGQNCPDQKGKSALTQKAKVPSAYKEHGGLQGEQKGEPCGSPQEPVIGIDQGYGGEDVGNEMKSVKEIDLKHLSKAHTILHKPNSVKGMEMLWQKEFHEKFGVAFGAFAAKTSGQLKLLMAKCPEGAADKVIVWLMEHWTLFAVTVEQEHGLKLSPSRPVVGFALQYLQTGLNLMKPKKRFKTKITPEPVQSIAPEPAIPDTPKYVPATPEEFAALMSEDDEQDPGT